MLRCDVNMLFTSLLMNRRRASLLCTATLAVLVGACRGGAGARNAEMGSFRAVGVGAAQDPTIRSARLLPEVVDESITYGTEAGGGSRVITSGLRVVTSPKGAIVAAEDRLPQAPASTIALPERLGGGFLFVIGTTLWRADRWLGPVKPIFTSSQPVTAILPGLDRVYVRSQTAVLAIDGRNGQVLDLGPWPASPYVASYAAADGWRAAAVTDMRGVVATFDAGATWRALDLPMEPKQVVVSADSLAVGGFESGRAETWYEVRPDGSIARLGAAPRDVHVKLTPTPTSGRTVFGGYPAPGGLVIPQPTPAPAASVRFAEVRGQQRPVIEPSNEDKEDTLAKTFGKRPLATAIEDGWPLTDGTAVIARDGSLARVRLSDGALIELVRDAFPLKPARCHPVTLTRPTAVGAFGFVCGEPRGTTVIYAYEPLRGRLSEIKRFDKPRTVTSSGNGALAVRGACAEDAEPTPPARPEPAKLDKLKDKDGKDKDKDSESDKSKDKKSKEPKLDPKAPDPSAAGKKDGDLDKDKDKEKDKDKDKEPPKAPVTEIHPYCVLGHDNTWREIHVRGDVGGERVVVLADGRIVVVSPPQGLGTPARITILDKGKATTAPVVWPRVTNDVARVLRLGLWLDGFEERRPGVIGGWIEAGGVMLGLEIALDGKATPGQYIRDAGFPFVSGKYGLGWTASRRGYETTDGGMTWTTIDLPDPLIPIARVERRACGPIGCIAHGWLRVGWGEAKHTPVPPPPAAYRAATALTTPHVQLACDPLASLPPPPPAPKPHASATTGVSSSSSSAPAILSPHGRIGFGGPPVLGSFNGLRDLQPFMSQGAPVLRDSERGINIDVRDLVDRFPSIGSVARVYGWGPQTGDWDTLGRWQVKWLSPFAGWPEVRASLPTVPPQVILDMTKAASYGGYGYGYGSRTDNWQLTPGDDAAHALLVGKRLIRSENVIYELEADRAPVEVKRADGEPFGEIEGVVRAAGRWFVAAPPTGASPGSASLQPMTVIWQIEGAVARELVRVPRAIPEIAQGTPAPTKTKLARRSDNRAIGLVAEGPSTSADRTTNMRWALPVDLESGALGEPESLGYVDLAGRTLEACTDDVVGWVLDTPMQSTSIRVKLPSGAGSINAVYARLRLTSARTCMERIAGNYDGQSQERAQQLTRAGAVAKTTTSLRPGELFATVASNQSRFPLRCTVSK